MEAFARTSPELIVVDIAALCAGYDFLRAIRKLPAEKGGRTPAVAITSAADFSQQDEALLSGFDACLVKPAGGEDLAHVISRLVDRVRESRKLRRSAEAPVDTPRDLLADFERHRRDLVDERIPPSASSREHIRSRAQTYVHVVAEPRIANRVVEALPEEDRKALAAAAHRVHLDRWETIYGVGDPIDAIYIPTGCLVSTLTVTESGKTVEVLSVGVNGLVGLDAVLVDRPSPHWVQTTVRGAAWRVGTRELRDLAESRPALRKALHGALFAQIAEMAQTAACNRAHRMDGQIARWILTTCDRTSSGQLRLSHEMIAERLGVRRASVSVAIESFQRDGLVTCARGKTEIRDRDGLRAVACECYEAIGQAR
jgi:CRP-like cAMP-binding protein